MFEKSFGQSFIFAAFQTYSGNFYITQSILEYIMEKSTHTSTRVFGSQESLGVKGIIFNPDERPDILKSSISELWIIT